MHHVEMTLSHSSIERPEPSASRWSGMMVRLRRSLLASVAAQARMSDLTALEGASDREIVAWIERRQRATLERWRRDLIVRPLR